MNKVALRFLVFACLCQPALKSEPQFEENRGQADISVRYFSRIHQGLAFFTQDTVVLHRPGVTEDLRLRLIGGNNDAEWEPEGLLADTVSYFVGRDPAKWIKEAHHFGRLLRRSVYPGIDVVFYGNSGQLEYDFRLAPHADASQIRMRVEGALRLSIGPNGDLIARTASGEVRQHRPLVYQFAKGGRKHAISGRFRRIAGNDIGFVLGPRDPSLPLEIDPVLESSTYLGGSAEETVIYQDYKYTVGSTSSIDFPGAALARRTGSHIFIRSGAATTIIGGSGDDHVTCASSGYPAGYFLLAGSTNSRDLPTNLSSSSNSLPLTPWQADYGGGESDGFVIEVVPNYPYPRFFVTYLGTPGDDRVTSIAQPAYGSPFAVVGTTTSRGLPAPKPNSEPLAPEPSGGLDGFLVLASPGYNSPTLSATAYFGGSGDDRPLSVTPAAYPDFGAYYIAGETNSPDFPAANGTPASIQGASEAFLMRVSLSNTNQLRLDASVLVGGNGAERGTGVATLPDGTVVLAGVTDSPDFPLAGAVQSNFGGVTDGFVSRWKSDLSVMISSTFLGGSGADQIDAVTADGFGNVYVAGSTSSHDFPVTNAVQPAYGGGTSDGFMVHFDSDGRIHQSTFLGGSGTDRVLGISTNSDYNLTIVGQTGSTDFPLVNAERDTLSGVSDGFVAHISASLLGMGMISGAKDLRVAAYALAGPPAGGGSGPPLTITSSDSTTVQVSASFGAPGQSSATLPSSLSRGSAFYVDCITDTGGADLLLSAPGYPPRTQRVNCYPPALSAFYSLPTTLGLWSTGRINLYLGVADGRSVSQFGSPRPGSLPPQVQISSSNPEVGTVSPSSITFPFPEREAQVGGAVQAQFTPHQSGSTTVSFTSRQVQAPANTATTYTVVSPISAPGTVLCPADFQAQIQTVGYLPGTFSQLPPLITLTSNDPSKVLLASDPKKPGSASLTLPQFTQGARTSILFVQCLAAEGEVPITVSAPGLQSVLMTVRLGRPALSLSSQNIVLGEGETSTLYLSVIPPFSGSAVPTLLLLNPDVDAMHISLENSNPSIVSVMPSVVDFNSGSLAQSVGLSVKGLAAGTATLSLKPPAGFAAASYPQETSVTVVARPLIMSAIELGKDLSAAMTILLPYSAPAGTSFTVSSNDPTRIILSPDSATPGQTQITARIFSASRSITFYVQGLAAQGSAKVTANIEGFGSIDAAVTLDPSGVAWSDDFYSAFLNGGSIGPSPVLVTCALDPATHVPVAVQSPRPGISAPIGVTNSNPDVATVDSSYKITSPSQAVVTVNGKTVGDTTLQIAQPPGFTVPSARQTLKVRITKL